MPDLLVLLLTDVLHYLGPVHVSYFGVSTTCITALKSSVPNVLWESTTCPALCVYEVAICLHISMPDTPSSFLAHWPLGPLLSFQCVHMRLQKERIC